MTDEADYKPRLEGDSLIIDVPFRTPLDDDDDADDEQDREPDADEIARSLERFDARCRREAAADTPPERFADFRGAKALEKYQSLLTEAAGCDFWRIPVDALQDRAEAWVRLHYPELTAANDAERARLDDYRGWKTRFGYR